MRKRSLLLPRPATDSRLISIPLFLLLFWCLTGAELVAQTTYCSRPAFGTSTMFPTGLPSPRNLVRDDFNGDGKADLAVVNIANTPNPSFISIHLGDGTGSFAAPSSFSSGGEGPIGLASGNFNEDSYPDLAVSHTFSNDITVFLNDGTGTFLALPAFFSGGLGPHTLITGLFNGDGQIDLAVVHFTTGDVDVFIGTGGGNFAPFSSLPGFGTNPRFLTSGDVNGDGNTDLAVAYPNGIIGAYYGNGTGAFAPGTAVSRYFPGIPAFGSSQR